MFQSYKDIISKLGEPWWHDANGVPRYTRFIPAKAQTFMQMRWPWWWASVRSAAKNLK
jgi:hypothetical protein